MLNEITKLWQSGFPNYSYSCVLVLGCVRDLSVDLDISKDITKSMANFHSQKHTVHVFKHTLFSLYL